MMDVEGEPKLQELGNASKDEFERYAAIFRAVVSRQHAACLSGWAGDQKR